MEAGAGAGAAQRGAAATGRRTVNQDDWDRHPWSRAFDLISGEYGWTDEQILDLLPARFYTITRSIQLRQDAGFRRQVDLLTAATRAVVASNAGSKEGAKKAGKLELLRPEKTVDTETPTEVSTEAALRMFGPPLIPEE